MVCRDVYEGVYLVFIQCLELFIECLDVYISGFQSTSLQNEVLTLFKVNYQ